ncbi:MAG: hypothetical protein JSW59_13685 [Phycisphaerales bacterium]|nr:MAG: hypothetical protein JSW59_13685 [Phycisphaerales bacterium]
MCRKLVLTICLILVLCLAGVGSAEMVAYWDFEGDFSDSVGGNDATPIGDTAIFLDPDRGRVAELDGTGDYIEIPNSPSLNVTGNEITVAAWVYFDDVSGPPEIVMAKPFVVGQHSSPYFSYGLHILSNGTPRFWLVTNGSAGNARGSTNLQSGTWYHMAGVYDGSQMTLYIDGEVAATTNKTGNITGYDTVLRLGTNGGLTEQMDGRLDDVRIYNHALDQIDIQTMMVQVGEGYPYATALDPKDGAIHLATWVTLSWRPGDFAVSHDVYLGESFDDVNDGAGDTFRGNQSGDTSLVGFPGFDYPDGLVPGTTYYWRIDEVNDADPNSPWKGEVWSFTVPPKKAYDPTPADGARYVGTEGTTLIWTGGMDSRLHSVYFGDNFDDVNDAAGAGLQTMASYNPGVLEPDKSYYWRVDEFDGLNTIKGDLWSFSTVPTLPVIDPSLLGWWKFDEGAGDTAVDWSGHGNHGTLIEAPQWVDGYDGGALDFEFANSNDGVAVRAFDVAAGGITLGAWVKPESFSQNDGRIITKATGTGENDHFWMLSTIASGGDYLRFRLKTDDGQNTTTLIAAGGALAVDEWTHAAATWDGASMVIYKDGVEVGREAKGGTAVATNPNLAIAIGNHLSGTTGNRAWDGLIDDVRVYNKALTVAELELAMRGDTARAWGPSPSQGSTADIVGALPLTWSAGDNATMHDVYFGTDRQAVANADASDTTGVYRGRQTATSFSPDEVEMGGGPYYWRIDEVAAAGTVTMGSVWRFTVADYIIVDDFESYNDIPAGEPGSNLVYVRWKDGFENPAANGSAIGYVTGASMETENVHGGNKSVPFQFTNTTAGVSEVVLDFTQAQDWTAHGTVVLSLWFVGASANVPGQLYVKVNGVQVSYDGAATDLNLLQWQRWDIDLTSFGTNLQNVTSFGVGVQGFNAIGMLLLDDIALHRSVP